MTEIEHRAAARAASEEAARRVGERARADAARLMARDEDLDPEGVLEESCVECGCTDEAACEGGCWWVIPAILCSRCDVGPSPDHPSATWREALG